MLLTLAMTYVLIRGSHHIMSGNDVSLETALSKREMYGPSFVWFRSKGTSYLIRDQATLERIDHLFDPERALDPEAERIEHELRPLEQRESELDDEIDSLTDRDDGPELTLAEEQKLDRLRREMDALHPKMRDLEQQEEDVDHKRDAREKEAEEQMVPILEDAVRTGVAKPIR